MKAQKRPRGSCRKARFSIVFGRAGEITYPFALAVYMISQDAEAFKMHCPELSGNFPELLGTGNFLLSDIALTERIWLAVYIALANDMGIMNGGSIGYTRIYELRRIALNYTGCQECGG